MNICARVGLLCAALPLRAASPAGTARNGCETIRLSLRLCGCVGPVLRRSPRSCIVFGFACFCISCTVLPPRCFCSGACSLSPPVLRQSVVAAMLAAAWRARYSHASEGLLCRLYGGSGGVARSLCFVAYGCSERACVCAVRLCPRVAPADAMQARGLAASAAWSAFAHLPRYCVRAVKEMDSKSIGLCPQGFESPRCRLAASCLQGWRFLH